jgi:hypothetical protein
MDATESTITSSNSLVNSLSDRGYLSETPQRRCFSSKGTPPVTACSPVWDMRAKLREVLIMLGHLTFSYVKTLVYLKTKHMAALIEQKVPRSQAGPSWPSGSYPDRILALVTLYAKLRVWFYTAKNRCLFDSLVLFTVLRSYNIKATLTIGVKSTPFFAAHAWVQIDQYVIDDSVEHVREYTPILTA